MPTATKPPTTKSAKRPVKKVATGRPAGTVTPARNDARGQIQVRLPSDLIERLEIEAVRRRVSKTFLVEQMITDNLPKWEEQDIAVI